jgi:hypothetical protein
VKAGFVWRDRRDWPYAVQLWRGGDLLIEVVHFTLGGLYMEVGACLRRIAKGHADRMVVDGVDEETVNRWRDGSW